MTRFTVLVNALYPDGTVAPTNVEVDSRHGADAFGRLLIAAFESVRREHHDADALDLTVTWTEVPA